MVKKVLLALLLLCVPNKSYAVNYYVSLPSNTPAGSDARSCGVSANITTPKATVVSGITCLTPGDTLFVRAGTYNEGISYVPSGTSWSNKVRIANYPGETVWLAPTTPPSGVARNIWLDCNCHYIEFDGLNLDGRPANISGIWVSTNNGNDPHHIRIQNAELITGAHGSDGAVQFGAHGSNMPIGATGSNEALNLVIHGGGLPGSCGFNCSEIAVYLIGPNNLVENCDMYDTSGAGLQIYSRADPASNNIVRNNRIHDITRSGDPGQLWGIIIALGTNNQIYNNIIYGLNFASTDPNGSAAIAVGGTGTKVYNNTIYNNVNTGISVAVSAVNAEIRNNIAYLSSVQNYYNIGTGTTHTNNLDNGTNPLFVNAASADFHLQTSSPARGIGADLTSVCPPCATDFDGNTRVVWDAGVYAFTAVVTPPDITSVSNMSWFWRVHHF